MGQYLYRATSRLVKLADGRKAHVAKYAYKPYHGWDARKDNARMHFTSGCVASERLKLKSDLLVVLYEHEHEHIGHLYHNPRGWRVFHDDTTFGTDVMPSLGEVRRVAAFVDEWFVMPAAA